MKKSVLIALAYICSICTLSAQANNYQPASDCSNYNAFAKNGQIEQIKPLVAAVRENGVLLLDPEKKDSMASIFQKMGVTTGTTFQLVKETRSRLDSTKFFRKYQQYYYGVEVDGGGYTTANIGTGDPGDPCADAYMLAPHILTGMALNPAPYISSTNIPSILDVQHTEYTRLMITHNLDNQCEYRLVWKAGYYKDYPKISWIDAQTGELIKTIDSRASHNAPTITYGEQYLNDKTVNGITSLETPDSNIKVYDFGLDCPTETTPELWSTTAIPKTEHPTEWTNESTQGAYQTFYAVTTVVSYYKGLGINFEKVNIGSCDEQGAFCLSGSNTSEAFVTIGVLGGPLGIFDVTAHELGHAFMFEFIQYDNLGTQTIHEAIADILGTYIESLVPNNNGTDWIIGDDVPQVAANLGRDLKGTSHNCFQNLVSYGIPHTRGLPLGHWFYLVSQGDAAKGIPALGTLPALNILLESLNLIDDNSDVPDLMEATMAIVQEQFGRCSNQLLSVARAWEAVCIPTGFAVNGTVPSCNFTIFGPDQVCEESEHAQFCATGGLPGAHYRFRIIGEKSDQYESLCGMIGNTQDGCSCLTLTEFPKYPYYPKYITIELSSPDVGPQFTQRKRLKLMDCNNDDPTCEEYHNLGSAPESRSYSTTGRPSGGAESGYVKVCAFDLMGRLVFEQSTNSLQVSEIWHKGMLILVYYDENAKIVKTGKIFLHD